MTDQTPAIAPLTHEYVLVTPELASQMLENNPSNRRLRPRQVAALARDMAAGNWTVSNDDVCIAADGTLLNGQHRLSAVTLSKTAVMMGVKRNVPTEAFRNMDTPIIRTAGDYLTAQGYANARNAAGCARLLFQTRRFMTNLTRDLNNINVTVTEVEQMFIDEPDFMHSVDVAMETNRVPGGLKLRIPPLAVAHRLIADAGNDIEVVDRYFSHLATPVDEPAGSPIHALRARVQSMRETKQTLPAANHLYMLLKNWNFWAKGESVARVFAAPNGDFYLPRPVVAPEGR